MFFTYVFDFDGTLIDSASLKRQGLFEVLKGADGFADVLSEILEANPAYTRVEIFESVSRALGPSFNIKISKLLSDYASWCLHNVARAPEIPGALRIIEYLATKGNAIYISSATPTDELMTHLDRRGFSRYVKKAFGAPERKESHLEEILTIEGHLPKSVLCVGDSVNDERIAFAKGCAFLGISSYPEADGFSSCTFADLNELMMWLRQKPSGWCLRK